MEKKLLEHKERQEMLKKILKKAYNTEFSDYVCTDEIGKPLRPNYVSEHFGVLLKKYGLRKIRLHDLRHAYVKTTLKKYNYFETST